MFLPFRMRLFIGLLGAAAIAALFFGVFAPAELLGNQSLFGLAVAAVKSDWTNALNYCWWPIAAIALIISLLTLSFTTKVNVSSEMAWFEKEAEHFEKKSAASAKKKEAREHARTAVILLMAASRFYQAHGHMQESLRLRKRYLPLHDRCRTSSHRQESRAIVKAPARSRHRDQEGHLSAQLTPQ